MEIGLDKPLTAIEAGILKKAGLKVINQKLFIDSDELKKKASARGRKSKNKGASYERVIATILTKWWDKSASEKLFMRTPASGAWKFPQDIVPPECCPFLISCKKEESWAGIENLLSTRANRFVTYWQELYDSMDVLRKSGRMFLNTIRVEMNDVIPMVIFSRNGMPNYVMISHIDILKLGQYIGGYPGKYIRFTLRPKKDKEEDNWIQNDFVMMLLEDFITWATPDGIKQFVNKI